MAKPDWESARDPPQPPAGLRNAPPLETDLHSYSTSTEEGTPATLRKWTILIFVSPDSRSLPFQNVSSVTLSLTVSDCVRILGDFCLHSPDRIPHQFTSSGRGSERAKRTPSTTLLTKPTQENPTSDHFTPCTANFRRPRGPLLTCIAPLQLDWILMMSLMPILRSRLIPQQRSSSEK